MTKGLIMVVEDDARIRKLHCDLLRHDGHTVFSARNGGEALSYLYSVVPTVVLLDIRMPGLDGLEVCRRIRKANLHHVPVVFLTNFDGAEIVRSAFEAGGDDYVLKCNGTKGVVERVRYWCRRGRDSEMLRRRESILAALRSGESPQLVEEVREPETANPSGTDG